MSYTWMDRKDELTHDDWKTLGEALGELNAERESDPDAGSDVLYLSIGAVDVEYDQMAFYEEHKPKYTVSVEYVGVDHPQFWQGVGVSGSDWEEVFVGVGWTVKDAFEDAADQLGAATGVDIGDIDNWKDDLGVDPELSVADVADVDEEDEEDMDGCELQLYVYIWYKAGC